MEVKATHLVAFFIIVGVAFIGVTYGGGKDTSAEDALRNDLEVSRAKVSEHLKTIESLKDEEADRVAHNVETSLELKTEQLKEKEQNKKLKHEEKELVASRAKEEETARKLATADRELVELRTKLEEAKKKVEEQTSKIEKLKETSKNESSTYQPIDKPIPSLRNRGDLPLILQAQGPDFKIGIELGVQYGYYSSDMLLAWTNCEKYYLVDLWGHLENYVDVANKADSEQEKIYKDAVQRLSAYGDKPEFMRMLTSNASQLFKERNTDPDSGLINPPFDFVYVDARHDYCGCKEDIESYWPLLKPGGIMAGHDYLEAIEVKGQDWAICGDGSTNPGAVKGAVDEFVVKNKLQLLVTYKEANWHTWIIRKPSNWKA